MGLKGNVEEAQHVTHFDSDSLSFRVLPEKSKYFLSLTDKTQKLFPVVSEDAKLSDLVFLL